MFAFKQWVGLLASPLVLAALTAVAAALCILFGKPRSGRWLLLCAVVIAYAGSTPAVGDLLIQPLEREYPPIPASGPLAKAQYLIVLGSAFRPRDQIPVTAAIGADGVLRVSEALRLWRQLGDARFIASGGAPPGLHAPAQGYAEFAREWGVPPESLIVLDTGLDTAGEARALVAKIGAAPCFLVTSAYHMPRAMLEMARVGAHPMPVPVGQVGGALSAHEIHYWLPGAGGLAESERALHEYLGLLALHLR